MLVQAIGGRALAVMLLTSCAACYTTRPLTTGVPAPETRVQAVLTDSGTVVMGGLIGTGALAVEGIVASADASAWDLRLMRVDHRTGSVAWNREVVRFPRNVLANANEKRLDRNRSLIAAGLVVAAAVLARELFSAVISDGDPGGEPPPPPAARVPPPGH
jgi:hypothetical protein